jgi:hypothetical protein
MGSRKAVNVSEGAHKRFRELNDKFALPQSVIVDTLFELVPVEELEAQLNKLAMELGPRTGPATGDRARLLRQLAGKLSNAELQRLVSEV